MNKNTIKAIQRRIDSHIRNMEYYPNGDKGWDQFDIGNYRYVLHYDNPELEPYVMRYSRIVGGFGYSSNPHFIGNIIDGKFIYSVFPVRRGA